MTAENKRTAVSLALILTMGITAPGLCTVQSHARRVDDMFYKGSARLITAFSAAELSNLVAGQTLWVSVGSAQRNAIQTSWAEVAVPSAISAQSNVDRLDVRFRFIWKAEMSWKQAGKQQSELIPIERYTASVDQIATGDAVSGLVITEPPTYSAFTADMPEDLAVRGPWLHTKIVELVTPLLKARGKVITGLPFEPSWAANPSAHPLTDFSAAESSLIAHLWEQHRDLMSKLDRRIADIRTRTTIPPNAIIDVGTQWLPMQEPRPLPVWGELKDVTVTPQVDIVFDLGAGSIQGECVGWILDL